MIRLVTVIGHGVELLPHFISHYTKYVDEICIVTYNSDLHPNIDDEVSFAHAVPYTYTNMQEKIIQLKN